METSENTLFLFINYSIHKKKHLCYNSFSHKHKCVERTCEYDMDMIHFGYI